MPRKRDIEATIAAHNDTDKPKQTLLPPEAARLLAVMFRRSSVCECSVGSLAGQGFDARTVRLLLRALVAAGFLPKEPTRSGLIATCQLHLPPQRRP